MFHEFRFHREEFLPHDHKRPKVESIFFAIERTFGTNASQLRNVHRGEADG
jgi:hypothetical protein